MRGAVGWALLVVGCQGTVWYEAKGGCAGAKGNAGSYAE